ncbi:MAG: hypothetical protein AAFW89_01095 [Bacteroidota bacterium]
MQPPQSRLVRIVLLTLLLMILLFLILSIAGQNSMFAQHHKSSADAGIHSSYTSIHLHMDTIAEHAQRTGKGTFHFGEYNQIAYTRTMGTNPINSKLQCASS